MHNSKYEEKLAVFSPIIGNKPISGAISSFNLFNNNREESREFCGGPTTIHCSEMKRLRRANFYLINPHSSSKKKKYLKRMKAAKKYLAQISKNCASTHCPRIETYERRLKLIMGTELMDIHA